MNVLFSFRLSICLFHLQFKHSKIWRENQCNTLICVLCRCGLAVGKMFCFLALLGFWSFVQELNWNSPSEWTLFVYFLFVRNDFCLNFLIGFTRSLDWFQRLFEYPLWSDICFWFLLFTRSFPPKWIGDSADFFAAASVYNVVVVVVVVSLFALK